MKALFNIKLIFFLLLIAIGASITTALFIPIHSTTVYFVYDCLLQALSIYFMVMIFYYVNTIKGVKISKLAIGAIVLVILYTWINYYMSKLEEYGPQSNGDLLLETIIQGISILAHIIIAIQLIKNESVDSSNLYLKIIGYSYCVMYLLRFTMSIFLIQNEFVSMYFDKIFTILSTLPYCAMALFYYHESIVKDKE